MKFFRVLILTFLVIPFVVFGEEKAVSVKDKATSVQEALSSVESESKPSGKKVTPLVEKKKSTKKDEPEKEVIPVVVDGDEISYLREERKILAKGNVKVKHEQATLYCDDVVYDAKTLMAHAKGNVKILQDGSGTIYGEDILYDFNTQNAKMMKVDMVDPPYYGSADTADKIGQEKYVFKEGGYITSCDLKDPHYKILARRIEIYPKDKIVAKNVIFKVKETPVLYLPKYSHNLKEEHFPVQIIPGKSKDLGQFVLMRYRYDLDKDNRGKFYADRYMNRGWAFGATHKADPDSFGQGLFKYYAIADKLYRMESRNSLYKRYPSREGIDLKDLEDDRYKAQMSYSWNPNPNLSVKAEFNKFSDPNFMKDYFYLEYEKEETPLSYMLVDYSFSNSAISLLTQKRVNRYQGQLEYLPKIEYNFYEQNLGESNFYFRSESSFSSLNSKTASSATDSAADSDAVRLYSHNVLSYSDNLKWLYINPYVGHYGVLYSKDSAGDEPFWRTTPELGTTLKTKLYKVLNLGFNLLGERVDVMRHVLTPEVTYKYVHPPSSLSSRVLSFDSYDGLSRSESTEFKLVNKLQARNEKETWDFIYFSPAATYIHNEMGKGSYLSSIVKDLEIYPAKGVTLSVESTYNVPERRTTNANFELALSDSKFAKYNFIVGHRYSKHDSSQGTIDFEYQLTPYLQVRNYLRHEYRTKDFQEQEHSFKVDLHCWWMEFGVNMKKQRMGVKDFLWWVYFTPKAFPDMQIQMDQDYNHGKRQY